MRLNPPRIDAHRFTLCTADKSFVAEVSDLGGLPLARLYDDACDAGFAMQSPRTGRITVWHFADEHRDGEGDVTHWTYHPTPESLRANPQLANWRVTIFND